MAGIDPTPPIKFTYKKLRTVAPQEIILDTTYEVIGNITTYNAPNWLKIIFLSKNGNLYSYRLTVDTAKAQNLAPGIYTVHPEFRFRAKIVFFVEKDVAIPCAVTLTVIDTIRLSLSPTVINFEYSVGGQVPGLNFLNVTTENSWSLVKDQSWITVNKTLGTGNTTVEIGANVAGLSVGNYSGTIQIDDGYDKKNVTVNLQVKGTNTSNDYLVFTPETIGVSVSHQEVVDIKKYFHLATSEASIIIVDVPWLVLDDENFAPGDNQSVGINVRNTESLDPGTYIGNVTAQSSFSSIKRQVLLTVNGVYLDGVEDNGFYFADDRKEVKMDSIIANSELILEYLTTVGNQLYPYTKKAPFFKGVGRSVLGGEAKNLIVPLDFTGDIITSVVKGADILNSRILAYDRIRNTTQQTLRRTYENVRVITGSSPKEDNWLTYMPKTIYSFPKGSIAFSFRADEPPENIQITGAVSANIAVEPIEGEVFTCFVNLSDYTLTKDDEIDIACGGFIVKIIIRAMEPETTTIVFLNEWNLPEIFNCSGFRENNIERDQTKARYFVDGKERQRILESRAPESYSVNTGFIYTQAEREWLAKILRSPKIWIWTNGRFEEVVCTTDRLRPYGTREFYNAYGLNFEKAYK